MNCVRCQKIIERQVSLICDHYLCLGCAKKVMKNQGVPPLDVKIRIVCPKCQKNTLSQCIEYLLKSENDSFLFQNQQQSEVDQKMLGRQLPCDPQNIQNFEKQLKQMSYTQRFSNLWVERKTPDLKERASRASNESKRSIKSCKKPKAFGNQNSFVSHCHLHKEQIMFFCGQEKKLMCLQCMYRHTKQFKNHKVLPISQASEIIRHQNKFLKQDAMKKIEQIEKSICACKGNMSKVEKAYEIHQQLIQKQFRQLEKLLSQKKQQVLQFLDKHFTKKQAEVTYQINDFKFIRNCYQEHFEYPLENQQNNLYFYNAYMKLKEETGKALKKVKLLEIDQLACFEKLKSIDEFQNLLNKFIKPKKESNSNRPTSHCENGDQKERIKNIDKDEIKIAKKVLNKLNKEQKQRAQKDKKDKNANYLCNYALNIQKFDNYDKKNVGKERKSSIAAFMHNQNQEQRKSHQSNKNLTPTRNTSARSKRN